MQNGMLFYARYQKDRKGNCRELISHNILESRAEIIESALRNYESAERYPRNSDEAIDRKINAIFESRIADEIENFKKIPSIKEAKIIKHKGFFKQGSFTPGCNYCGENMTAIEAEVTIKINKRREQKENVKLFYFCYNCGFSGEMKKSLITRSYR